MYREDRFIGELPQSIEIGETSPDLVGKASHEFPLLTLLLLPAFTSCQIGCYATRVDPQKPLTAGWPSPERYLTHKKSPETKTGIEGLIPKSLQKLHPYSRITGSLLKNAKKISVRSPHVVEASTDASCDRT